VRADKQAPAAVKPLDKPAKPGAQAGKPGDKPAKPGAKKGDPIDVDGVVTEVSADEKTITVALGGKVKGEDPKTATLKIDDGTRVLFTGVGPGEAKARKGYRVSAWLAEKSKDRYVRVLFSGPSAKGPPPDVAGLVTAVSGDNMAFKVTIPGKKKVKGQADSEEKDREVTVKLTAKTIVRFNGVGRGEASLVKGLEARVWLAKQAKDTAAQVQLGGSAKAGFKKTDGKRPAHAGQVMAAADDGKTFTLEIPPKAKGEQPTKMDVKLGAAARQVFVNVRPGGARAQAGYHAVLWQDDKGEIVLVAFSGAEKSKHAVLAGEVKAVAGDGRSFTVHLSPKKKGEEGEDVQVKLGSDARVVFHNVGPGGARIATGYQARAQLEEGSKDTALSVVFSGAEKAEK
jgi:hypothetical protein